jgi:superfamily II DNA or RNA helicase
MRERALATGRRGPIVEGVVTDGVAAPVTAAPEVVQDPETEHSSLRPYQRRVLADFWRFFAEAEDDPRPRSRFGRIVLPPRTGKTIIAAQIAMTTGLRTLFVVPTRTLVEQTAAELEGWLGRPVGTYFGERKAVEEAGPNVTTYAILQSEWREGRPWPEAIRGAELVFLDEGHHVMTPERLDLVERGFSTDALRIALTATPDYDEARTLCRYFPALIHEMTLEEALGLGLLAPLRLWVAEVDAAGSEVRLAAGDYDEQSLGRVMSGMPFVEAAMAFRYARPNAPKPALVACASRQQASDLLDYFERHRPHGTPSPRLVLGETPRNVRQVALEEFESGRVDTLIQVGVLVEGWSSPRCKLLIDLAPSVSLVRSTQKYFRVMTRSEGEEARIFVLLPDGIPGRPVLPTELFGHWLDEYECGSLIVADEHGGQRRGLVEALDIAGVRVRQRIVRHRRLELPRLDPRDRAAVGQVLQSCQGFSWHRPCSLARFRDLEISHPLYDGTGYGLLRWLGYAVTKTGYARFLRDTLGVLAAADTTMGDPPLDAARDTSHLLGALHEPALNEAERTAFAAGWRALVGSSADPADAAHALDPEQRLLRAEQAGLLAYAVGLLPLRRRRVMAQYFGLLGERPRSTIELGVTEEVSSARASQIVRRGCSDILWMLDGMRVPAESSGARARVSEEGYRRLLAVGADRSRPYSRYSPPQPLYACRPRRLCGPAGGSACWWQLPRRVELHELDRLLGSLAARLGCHRVEVAELAASPAADEGDLQTHEHAVRCVWWTSPYFWSMHAGGEGSDVALDADVGVPGELVLWLTGASGFFHAYSVRGAVEASVTRLETAWIDVISRSAAEKLV